MNDQFHEQFNIEDRWEQTVRFDTIRCVEEIFEHEIETTSLSILLEIPQYLSTIESVEFQSFIKSTKHISFTINDQERLRAILILLHQRHILESEKTLWFLHLKLGTTSARDIDVPYPYWSERLKHIIRCVSRTTTITDMDKIKLDDQRCEKFVRQHLFDIEEAHQNCIHQLTVKQKEFSDYHRILEPVLEIFVGEQFKLTYRSYDHRMKILVIDAKRAAFEKDLRTQSINVQQKQYIRRILEYKYQYEKAKHESKFLKELIARNKLPDWLTSFNSSLPYIINELRDSTRREYFQRQQQQILDEFHVQLRKLMIEVYDTKYHEAQQVFEMEVALFWEHDNTVPTEQRFTTNGNKILEQYFQIIEERLQTIYSYKLTTIHC